MIIRTLLVSLLVLTAGTAWAGETTSNFDFTVTLTNGCIITNNTNLTINHSVVNNNSDGTFTVTHACTSGTAYTVNIGDGNNASSGVRRAIKGTTDYVKYRLFWDVGRTQEIGVGTGNTQNGTGTGSAVTTTIYARVASSENSGIPHGTYTDNLRFTLIW